MEKNYYKDQWQIFLNSLKLKKNILYVILLDLLCICATFVLSLFYSLATSKIAASLQNLDLANIAAMGAEGLEQYAALKGAMYLFLIYSAILFILILLAYSLFQGLIWNTVLKKRFTWKYFGKFSLLNLIWVLAWLIISILLLFILKDAVIILVILTYVLLFVMFYLTTILYVMFTKKRKMWQSIKDTFNIGKRVHLFILPYLLVLGLFIVLNLVLIIFSLLPQQIYMFINLIILLAFFAWFRFYISDVIMKVGKKFKYVK